MQTQLAELHSDILRMNDVLRETMADVQKLSELVEEVSREMFLCYSKLDREWILLTWLRIMEEEYKKTIEEDEEDEAKSPDLETISFNISEKPSDTNSIFLTMKLPKHELKESSKLSLEVFSDSDNKNGDNIDVSNDSETSSQQAKCEQKENQWISSVIDNNDTSQVMKESEEKKISSNLFHQNPNFTTSECDERVMDKSKEEQALLMERQWIEWMDKQEMSGNQVKAEQNTQKQEEAAPSVSQKKVTQNKQGEGTMKKIKAHLRDLFNPHSLYKWERLEEED